MKASQWLPTGVLVVSTCGALVLILHSPASDEALDLAARADAVDERLLPADDELDEHGLTKRALDDPMVAHLTGTVRNEGRPVRGARVQATVTPTGMSFFVEEVTTRSDGTFDLPIRSSRLREQQRIFVEIIADRMTGHAVVVAEPGKTTADLRLEIAAPMAVRGRVIDETGGVPDWYGSPPLSVCCGVDCARMKRDGSFELETAQLGRRRLEVRGGRTEYALGKVAPIVALEDSSGPYLLHVDAATSKRELASYDSEDVAAGVTVARVVTPRNGRRPTTILCDVPHGRQDIVLHDGAVPLLVPVVRDAHGSRIECIADGFVRIRLRDPDRRAIIDLPFAMTPFDEIDLGVELRDEPLGARVVDVADEAQAAGIQIGDIITAVDGISMAGMSALVVRTVGFRLPRGESSRITVQRGPELLSLVLHAPP